MRWLGTKRPRASARSSANRGEQGPAFLVTFSRGSDHLFYGRETCYFDGDGKSLPPLDVTYTNAPESVAAWLEYTLFRGGATALSFDTETRPSFAKQRSGQERTGPSILQLATDCGKCLVVQMAGPPPRRNSSMWALGNRVSLFGAPRPVLSDPALLKAGVGMDEDCMGLWRSTHRAVEVIIA